MNDFNGYVPNNNGIPIVRSGVNIESGFDLGQHNSYDMVRILGTGTENMDLITLYSPYLGLQGVAAINYLANHPLNITQEQANRTDIAVMQSFLPRIRNQYNNITNGNFDNLPNQAQTVIFDLGYQLGPNRIPRDIMLAIDQGDYSGAATLLENIGRTSGYTARRNAEASLLRQLNNVNQNRQNTNQTNRHNMIE